MGPAFRDICRPEPSLAGDDGEGDRTLQDVLNLRPHALARPAHRGASDAGTPDAAALPLCSVHCSLWTDRGDPDDLAARYEAMMAEIPPEAIQFAACIRTPDGIVIIDTCPSKEVFDEFVASEGFQALLARHGLDTPASLTDHPVVAAFAGGRRVES